MSDSFCPDYYRGLATPDAYAPDGWWKPVDKPENYSPHTVVSDWPARDLPTPLDDVGRAALRPAPDWRSECEWDNEALRTENRELRAENQVLRATCQALRATLNAALRWKIS